MRFAVVAAALAAVAVAAPAAPASGPPPGCATTVAAPFEITVVNVTSPAKRSLVARDALMITLTNGVLTDQTGRIGDIVANHQFQFDPAPGQAGALYTSGFSVCANGTLAIGGNAIFYQCLSGSFYNLYDQSQGPQCNAIYIVTTGASSGNTASVMQLTDGQPIATSASAPVSQIGDGQVQASTGAKVSQITDGQVQAPTSTGAKVSQITDGQLQAPTSTGAKVSQITDGQLQAPTTTGAKVSQITDGQLQAPTKTSAVQAFTGAAVANAGNAVAAIAGLAAAVALL